jgi:hypothetical protein
MSETLILPAGKAAKPHATPHAGYSSPPLLLRRGVLRQAIQSSPDMAANSTPWMLQ